LRSNNIINVSPLSSLVNLKKLSLCENYIDSVTSLANLSNLTELDLNWNRISDITPVTSLINLTLLDIRNNQITELPLTIIDLQKLKTFMFDEDGDTDEDRYNGICRPDFVYITNLDDPIIKTWLETI